MLGWDHTFVHELDHLLAAIRNRNSVTPHGADFRDGYRASVVTDAILRSGREGRRVAVEYVGI
jgi:predicted dehydrogenase